MVIFDATGFPSGAYKVRYEIDVDDRRAGQLEGQVMYVANVAPVFAQSPPVGPVTVPENTTAVGAPGLFAATDADSEDEVTYSLSGADASLFNISAGTLMFKEESAPNFEIRNTLEVTVVATGGAATDYTYTVTDTDDDTDTLMFSITVGIGQATGLSLRLRHGSIVIMDVREGDTQPITVLATPTPAGSVFATAQQVTFTLTPPPMRPASAADPFVGYDAVAPRTITFPAGSADAIEFPFILTTIEDNFAHRNFHITVTATAAPSGITATAMIGLLNDDIPITVSPQKLTVVQGGSATYTLSAGGGPSVSVLSCFKNRAECDLCVMRPHTCHYHRGTCRDEKWGERHCMQPHCVYIANSSGLKVGITRNSQLPTRWIDQGASQALGVFKVKTRLHSGLLESALAKYISDRTDWRKMLKGVAAPVDLHAAAARLLGEAENELADLKKAHGFGWERLAEPTVRITYPVSKYPEKVTSFNFDKTATVAGRLNGIKGQYLLFDHGVINMRKFSGYEVVVS